MTGPLAERLAAMPLVAILRGLEPERAHEIASTLIECGFLALEVPLTSPCPFESIAIASEVAADRAVVGAGTVRRVDEVRHVADAGGRLVVMPHADLALVAEAKQHDLWTVPGVATPTEGFAAVDAGADALKLFPAEAMPPSVVRAWRAVFSREVWLLPVGGITPERMRDYWQAGASGFGLGSALFAPDRSAAEVRASARRFTAELGRVRTSAVTSAMPQEGN